MGHQFEQHRIGYVFPALLCRNDILEVSASLFATRLVVGDMLLSVGRSGVRCRELPEKADELGPLGL